MESSTKNTSFAHRRTVGSVLKALVVCATVALACAADAATKKIGNYIWTYTAVKGGVQIGDGVNVAAVPCCSDSTLLLGPLTIPSKIGNSPVKSIAANAFKGCDSITGVTIPKGVTSIGASAFWGCECIQKVAMPSTLTSIGKYAFWGCKSLSSATLPSSVRSIGDYAFATCESLQRVAVPKGVKKIGDGTFTGCSQLVKVTLPSTVTSIGDGAFHGCGSLKSASIPSSVTSIGNYAFQNAGLTSISIPGSVKTLGNYVFDGCASLKTVIMNSGVTEIGEGAFSDCSVLEKIALPHSLTTIGQSAFYRSFASGATVFYEYNGTDEIESDEDRFKRLLANPGSADVSKLTFILRCKLTLKPNNTKYGTALISDDDVPSASAWRLSDETVHLVAKPKKGYVFAGWYANKACTVPFDEDMFDLGDYQKKTVDIYMPSKHTTIYAKFITKAADKKALKFTSAAKKLATTATKLGSGECAHIKVRASSASRVTYSAKGLPTGLSIDDETGEITGTAMKPGSFTATVTAKSAGGYTVTQKVKLTVYVYEEVRGAYYGYTQPGTKASDPPATLTFSVGSTGKVTGKINWKDKAYSFTAQCSYSTPSLTKFSPSIKIGKTTFKPGVVVIDVNDYCASAYVLGDDKPAFNAYSKAYLFETDGPLASYAGYEATLTDVDDSVPVVLKVLFKNNDTVTIAGTVNGKPVTVSTQLSLKQKGQSGTSDEFDVVVPVILYKYKYYRAFWFTFLRDSSGNVRLEGSATGIRPIGDMR